MGTTLLALLHRDVHVAMREFKSFLLRVGLQPILFTFIFGYVMPRIGVVQRGYNSMLLPGMLALSMTMSSMQAVALPLVIDFGWSKEIEDRLLAPISIMGVAAEKILVGIIQAVIAGMIVLPATWLIMGGQISLGLRDSLFLAGVALLTGWLFAAFGMVIGTVAAPQHVSLIFTVLLSPLIFFGCTYYPWAALHNIRWFQMLVLINPLVYASEGFRAALTPQLPHMPLWLILSGLLGFSLFFTYFGLKQFERRAID